MKSVQVHPPLLESRSSNSYNAPYDVGAPAPDGLSLGLIGNASAHDGRSKGIRVAAEAFSISRREGSRWRLRRTRYGDGRPFWYR